LLYHGHNRGWFEVCISCGLPEFTTLTISRSIWDRTTITIGGSAVKCFVSDTLVALPCPGECRDKVFEMSI
jgi:hypothetical protein